MTTHERAVLNLLAIQAVANAVPASAAGRYLMRKLCLAYIAEFEDYLVHMLLSCWPDGEEPGREYEDIIMQMEGVL